MAVTCRQSVGVVELNQFSISIAPTGKNHGAVRNGDHWLPRWRAKIHGQMGSDVTQSRVRTGAAKTGGDPGIEVWRGGEHRAFHRVSFLVIVLVSEQEGPIVMSGVHKF